MKLNFSTVPSVAANRKYLFIFLLSQTHIKKQKRGTYCECFKQFLTSSQFGLCAPSCLNNLVDQRGAVALSA